MVHFNSGDLCVVSETNGNILVELEATVVLRRVVENTLVSGGAEVDELVRGEVEETTVDQISVVVDIFGVVVIAVDTVEGIGDPVSVVDEEVVLVSVELDGISVVQISFGVEILGVVAISVGDEVVIVGMKVDGLSVV